jgi:hypothetical protein
MTRLRLIPALLGATVLAACSGDGIQSIAGPTSGAYIKFYNFGLNAPGVNFYANDKKVTAVSSTTGIESTNGTAYGSVGNGGLYSSIAPGQYSFSGRIAAATDNGLQIAKLSTTLGDGKYYSLYTAGFYDPNAKTIDSFVLEDVFPTDIDFTKTLVRFVNASPNSSPMTLYIKNPATGDSAAVASNVAFKSGSAFIGGPGGVYDLTVRYPGSNTAVIVRTAVSLSNGHVYTISSRGDMTVTSTTATNRPQLDNTANR